MQQTSQDELFDVAIVGGGPAGLSAALLLGRSKRRVIVCDDGHPRNYAAKAVHGYLGHDGISPTELRRRGVEECRSYNVAFVAERVVQASCGENESGGSAFELRLTSQTTIRARKLLLATGVVDDLPEISGLKEFYGASVHHCPYCDGWEHRNQRLVAFGNGAVATKLAITLLAWSPHVCCCTNGVAICEDDAERLSKYGVLYRSERVTGLSGLNGVVSEVQFANGGPHNCDALFFSAGQGQRSDLPAMLGCERDKKGVVQTTDKQGSGVRGLFLAGDADGDVQFAIVAAAEGAIAATAVNSELQQEDYP